MDRLAGDRPAPTPTPSEEPVIATPLCSKCGIRPRVNPTSSNTWCKQCREDSQRDWQEGKLARKQKAGFALGVRKTKELFANEFRRLGSGYFDGYEIARLIEQAPGPSFAEVEAEPEPVAPPSEA
jgi:hypothetical protein